jgi:hypothetical protein
MLLHGKQDKFICTNWQFGTTKIGAKITDNFIWKWIRWPNFYGGCLVQVLIFGMENSVRIWSYKVSKIMGLLRDTWAWKRINSPSMRRYYSSMRIKEMDTCLINSNFSKKDVCAHNLFVNGRCYPFIEKWQKHDFWLCVINYLSRHESSTPSVLFYLLLASLFLNYL